MDEMTSLKKQLADKNIMISEMQYEHKRSKFNMGLLTAFIAILYIIHLSFVYIRY